MKNYGLLSDHTLTTASGEDLEVERMGCLYEGFRLDSEQKLGTTMNQIIRLKDVFFFPGLTSNLLSYTSYVADGFEFDGKEKYTIPCGGWLRFPVVDCPYSLYGFPITKRMFKIMPYIRDGSGNDTHDAKNVWIGDYVSNTAAVAPSRASSTEFDIFVFYAPIRHIHEP